MLTSTRPLLDVAKAARIAQGAFNVVHLETAEAIVAGAETAERPVILQISENCVRYHGGLEPLAVAVLELARRASVPVAVHLDHAESVELALAAIDLGVSSVMYDGASLPYSDNVTNTAQIVARAHACAVDVEAEIGVIGGKDGAHAPGVRTDPDEAAEFASATGVDALAVAVGSSHAMNRRTAALDLELIHRIANRVDVPLVLHGGSGVADPELRAAARAGMSKINVSTHLNGFFTGAIREFLTAHPEVIDSRRYMRAARHAVAEEVARLLRLFTTPAESGADALAAAPLQAEIYDLPVTPGSLDA